MVAYEEMTVLELKELLGKRGLKKTGLKARLIKRLRGEGPRSPERRRDRIKRLGKFTPTSATKAEAIQWILNRQRK
uniref:SAP domain-containing protein n=1 Tax=viral metagenome TaxID=1070528 RepID=A0A6C0JXD9_9ZZZZ